MKGFYISFPKKKFPVFGFVFFLSLVLAGSIGIYWQFYRPAPASDQETRLKVPDVKDSYIEFASETYDKIKTNYWDKIADEKLSELFRLAAVKVLKNEQTLASQDREGVRRLMAQIVKDAPDDKKKEHVIAIADLVLVNLQPFGRSRLYATKQVQALRNVVENKDPDSDLYAVLGVTKDTPPEKVEDAYQQKVTELKKDHSPEATEELAQVNRAREALGAPESKKQYDENKTEPTVISRLVHPDIFYLKLTKFSPQSFEELQKTANAIDPRQKNGPTALIFDLQGNIGGAIDILQYFLGPFIGPDQYAYEFFHQGEKTPFKTKTGWLASLGRYKKVVILIDGKSQSSAEVMIATLKKYNVGVVVGAKTKGWGTVEQIIPIDQQIDPTEKYSILMAHSLTLRDDGQPIESRGVEPTISIEDKDWDRQLLEYFNYPALIRAVKEVLY